ncbi:hypothetical protein AMS68_002111 [Peltaster fructicola]|uniref:Uncharacterized protein n=1 Tax=Peltaster fructicola TaxID=286661 RepID=A0A6H0XPD8_9PEZI|nr:hypothetical protein AMS68_002111 [Peltaster fructicola]
MAAAKNQHASKKQGAKRKHAAQSTVPKKQASKATSSHARSVGRKIKAEFKVENELKQKCEQTTDTVHAQGNHSTAAAALKPSQKFSGIRRSKSVKVTKTKKSNDSAKVKSRKSRTAYGSDSIPDGDHSSDPDYVDDSASIESNDTVIDGSKDYGGRFHLKEVRGRGTKTGTILSTGIPGQYVEEDGSRHYSVMLERNGEVRMLHDKPVVKSRKK